MDLKAAIEQTLPEFYAVTYSEALLGGLVLYVVDLRKESVQVTIHNSENIFILFDHNGNGVWEKGIANSTNGVKFRKINGKSKEDGDIKLLRWFQRNAEKFYSAPPRAR